MADVILEIDGDDKPIRRTLSRTSRAASRGGLKAANAFSNSLSRGLNSGLTKVVGTAAAAGAAIGGALFARASIRAAIQQEEAINNLNQSLIRTGQFSEETSRDIQNFASSLQQATTTGDEVILQQIALAQSFGATAEQSKQLVAASLDLAAAQGRSVNEAVRQVSKTLGGYAGELGEVLPELKELTQEQLRSGEAIDLIAEKFDGFAKGQARTFAGAVKQVGNNFGDLRESIGFLITQNPDVIKAVNALSQGFVSLQNVVNDNREVLASLITDIFGGIVTASEFVVVGILDVVQSFQQLQDFGRDFALQRNLADLREELKSLREEERRQIETTGRVTKAQSDLIDITKQQIAIFTQEGDIEQQKNNERLQSLEALKSKVQELGQSIKSSLGEGAAADLFPNANTEEDEGDSGEEQAPFAEQTTALEALGLAYKETFQGIKNQLSSAAQTQEEFAKQLQELGGKVVKSFAGGVSQAFGQVGRAIANGSNAFEAFGQALVGTLGTVSQSIGQSFILQGAGFLFTNPAVGLGLIGAGAALSTFGGFLSASSGGVSGGSPSTSASASTNTSAPFSGDDTTFREEEERQAQQQVQLVVNGDILDSEDTGRRLVELLNNNFESESSSLVGASFA